MSKKAETILKRYKKGYVTDEQLLRYMELGAITQDEYCAIYATKHKDTDQENVQEEKENTVFDNSEEK